MTDYELFRSVRARLETVWKEADRRRSWRGGFDLGQGEELETSRETGGASTRPSSPPRSMEMPAEDVASPEPRWAPSPSSAAIGPKLLDVHGAQRRADGA